MPSFQRLDDPSPFICRRSDSVLAGIERCLDNGVGLCFVVQGRRIIGRLDLDDLRQALREGALARHANLGHSGRKVSAGTSTRSRPQRQKTWQYTLISQSGGGFVTWKLCRVSIWRTQFCSFGCSAIGAWPSGTLPK